MKVSNNFCRAIVTVAWLCLGLTAIAKLISAFGHAPLLEAIDPVLGLRVRSMMIAAAIFEGCVCVGLLILPNPFWQGLCLITLGGEFSLYHLARMVMGIHGPCQCLGTAWGWLPWTHITEAKVEHIAVWLTAVIVVCGVVLIYADEGQLSKRHRTAAV